MIQDERIYNNYVEHCVDINKGKPLLSDIEKQFSAWNVYYGRHLPNDKTSNIFEVGCGNGEIVYWLKKLGFEKAAGIDGNKDQIKAAHKLFGDAISVSAYDLRIFLKDKTNVYDCIIARDVIEHFSKEEMLNSLDILYNALKPSGILIIQTPNAESPFGSRTRYCDFTHEVSFTRTSLYHVLKSAGFKEVNFYPMRPVAHGMLSMVRWFLWCIIELLARFYLLVETGSPKGIFTQNMVVITRK